MPLRRHVARGRFGESWRKAYRLGADIADKGGVKGMGAASARHGVVVFSRVGDRKTADEIVAREKAVREIVGAYEKRSPCASRLPQTPGVFTSASRLSTPMPRKCSRTAPAAAVSRGRSPPGRTARTSVSTRTTSRPSGGSSTPSTRRSGRLPSTATIRRRFEHVFPSTGTRS